MAEYSFSKNAKTSLAAKETFRDIQGKIRDGEWKFPAQVTNSNVLTSALLIEGYGLFIEKLTGEERFRFVESIIRKPYNGDITVTERRK